MINYPIGKFGFFLDWKIGILIVLQIVKFWKFVKFLDRTVSEIIFEIAKFGELLKFKLENQQISKIF